MDISRYYSEFDRHLLETDKPSDYFNMLAAENEFPNDFPFSLILDLKDVKQSPVHHPEGSVWNHTMLVVDAAAQRRNLSRDKRVFMWAALLHDLGKIPTTKTRKGRITAYGHDTEGEKLARRFLEECEKDESFIKRICALVRWHMQPMYVLKHLPFADLKSMKGEVDTTEVALLYFCDRLGRGTLNKEEMAKEIENTQIFLDICQSRRSSIYN